MVHSVKGFIRCIKKQVYPGFLIHPQLYRLPHVVADAPQIDTSPALGKAAAADGGVAIMRCQAEGAPEVTFKWKKVTSNMFESPDDTGRM